MTEPAPGSREALAALILKAGWDANDSPDSDSCGFDSDLFTAEALIAAGWRWDGSCRDAQAGDICGWCGHIRWVHTSLGCDAEAGGPFDECECVGFNPTFDS